MTEPPGAGEPASTGQALMHRAAAPAPEVERLARWGRKHAVLLVALLMIAIQLVWKARLLHGLYFLRDDFHDLDLAAEHPLNWGYLTYIFDGHLIIGLRLV